MAVINGIEFASVSDDAAARGRAIVQGKPDDQLRAMAIAAVTALANNPGTPRLIVAREQVAEELTRRGIEYTPVADAAVSFRIVGSGPVRVA